MAFDGIVISNIVNELKSKLTGGRILKISQPEKDELILTIKNYDQYRLLLSADASLPLLYISSVSKEAPLTSPAFCMLLRKHLTGARILDIVQPGLERAVTFELEHLNEMGDLCKKKLIIEIMGKHSNIIFCDNENRIIDSIKRVPGTISSVREVLPGRDYFIPKTDEKLNPLDVLEQDFVNVISKSSLPVDKAIYTGFTGISPLIASEITFRAGIEPGTNTAELSADIKTHLYKTFIRLMDEVKNCEFYPNIVYCNKEPKEFSSVKLTCLLSGEDTTECLKDGISELLECYYSAKNTLTRIRQKSVDLRHIVTVCTERAAKKYDLQMTQLKDTEKREKYKIYGELLTTYGYSIEAGAKEAVVNNYYTGEDIKITLNPEISAIENAKRFFEKYSKLKRTYEALTKFTVETREELDYLESIKMALEIAAREEDLGAIKQELVEAGYMKGDRSKNGMRQKRDVKGNFKGNGKNKSGRNVSMPFHYVTEDGFHIYVGKNNFQNDELTFKFANGSDWWFHAKGVPGSHVVLKTDGKEVPDRVFEQAAALAAFYSKNKENEKVEVDYLERKNVKKPNGAKPGFVVYYTNYSMVAIPGVSGMEEV